MPHINGMRYDFPTNSLWVISIAPKYDVKCNVLSRTMDTNILTLIRNIQFNGKSASFIKGNNHL